MMFKRLLPLSFFLVLVSCSTSRRSGTKDNGKINITFMLVNDVYEIAPLENGRSGGFARVAYVAKSEKKKNPNTLLVMAGDFLSPSVYNSLQYEGKRIRGRQMVETMNASGVDLAIFGNHEFDISESELQSRINESEFEWISTNAFHKKGNEVAPFMKVQGAKEEVIPESRILTMRDADGTIVRVGVISATLPFNRAAYVSYTDPLSAAEQEYNQIKDSCDVVVAITHQQMQEDILLAQRLPKLALILGGHEHDQRFEKAGGVTIAKAHANARTAYILNLSINTKSGEHKLRSRLKKIDSTVPLDLATDSIVTKWSVIAEKNYSSIGFDPKKIVLNTGAPLDGRESEVRTVPTNLTRLIVSAIEATAPAADLAILNSGSIRVDDVLQMPVTQYDILRTLPFGGGITEVDMKGSLLIRLLNDGLKNRGIGGFLHFSSSVSYNTDSKIWRLKDISIDPARSYRVALTEFLLTGGEANMGYLKPDNKEIIKIYPTPKDTSNPMSDVRLAIIKHLELSRISKN